MNVRLHPRYSEFVYRLATIAPKAAPWKGVTFRSVELEHAAPEQIISGEGSFRHGARWNAPDKFPVVYLSTRPGTAAEEAFQLAAECELAPDDLQPRVICGIEADLARVLDLTGDLPDWLHLSQWMHEDFRAIKTPDTKRSVRHFGERREIPA